MKMRNTIRERKQRRDTLVAVALFVVSTSTLVALFAGAIYCDYDPNAIDGECMQSIYNALFV